MSGHDSYAIGPVFRGQVARHIERAKPYFLGKDVFIFSDYSECAGWSVFAFLACEVDQCAQWFLASGKVRADFLAKGRRMSYKGMNDGRRRAALLPFLHAADSIAGVLVVVAFSKGRFDQVVSPKTDVMNKLFCEWKARVREKVLVCADIAAYLGNVLACPGRKVYWFTDNDDIAANDVQLMKLRKLFWALSSEDGRLDTEVMTPSQMPSLRVEDMLSVPDLMAGSVANVLDELSQRKLYCQRVTIPMSGFVKAKANVVLNWSTRSSRLIKCPIKIVRGIGTRIGHSFLTIHPMRLEDYQHGI